MPAPLLLDLTHTCHTRARTGIQRVTRALRHVLGSEAIAVTHDPHRRQWRELEPWEMANLEATEPAARRGARWPLAARCRGYLARWAGRTPSPLPGNSGLIVPEVFSPRVAAAQPALFRAVQGPRVALFHDAIALQLPELTPPGTVARFPAYLTELLAFDGIAAISAASRETLIDYWRWLGVKQTPPVHVLPLGVDAVAIPSAVAATRSGTAPTILSVGSIEGRKNHLALLEAAEGLWSQGLEFSLHLIGLAQPETGGPALAKIRTLQESGRPLRYDGPVDDATLTAAYAACDFTVYPSLLEGFGLPVIESLRHGKPCVCSGHGALGESARGGGCLTCGTVDAGGLAQAIRRLLEDAKTRERLAAEARARSFRTWADYAAELRDWMRTVPRRG